MATAPSTAHKGAGRRRIAMILKPGDLPVLVFALHSFGLKEEVRIGEVCYPHALFSLHAKRRTRRFFISMRGWL